MRSRVWVAATATGGLLGLVLGLAGCGTGQDAQTADTLSSIPGVNADDAGVAVRNVRVPFNRAGYPAGADAAVELSIVNNTQGPVQLVDLSSPAASSVTVAGTTRVGGSGTPGQPGGPPNGGPGPQLLVEPGGLVEARLQVSGLTEGLDGTRPLPITLAFDNGATFMLEVPTAAPAEPLPRETPTEAEHEE